jgi:hypothetical protein
VSIHPALSPANRSHHDRSTLVTLMLTTVPGPRMRRRDAARLSALVRRFEQEAARSAPGPLHLASQMSRLRHAVDVAKRQRTRRALAVFVAADWDHTVTLPQAVYDRVVVDSHFDARDLLYAEQFHAPFRVLAGDRGRPLLLDSRNDTLIERPLLPVRSCVTTDGRAFARLVAGRIAEIDARDPRPLLLAHPDPIFASQAAAVVGSCAGQIDHRPGELTDLYRAARLRVTEWRNDQARMSIPTGIERGWVCGSAEVQRAVAANPRGFMLVEANRNDGFHRGVHIIRPTEFGFRRVGLNAAIARTRAGGGTVRFVPDGELRHLGGVAYRTAPA